MCDEIEILPYVFSIQFLIRTLYLYVKFLVALKKAEQRKTEESLSKELKFRRHV